MANIILVAGLGFGDEGKGGVVDFLTRKHDAKLVCRYNGGSQAAHNVITPDGRHHTFSQFGSGTFVEGCRTHLSRFMLVQPGSMLSEARHLGEVGVSDAFDRVTVDSNAPVTTRFHMAVNRLRELSRSGARHGSCGMGIGETVVDHLDLGGDILFVGDLTDATVTRRKLQELQARNRAKVAHLIKDILPSPTRDAEWGWLDKPVGIDEEALTCRLFAGKIKVVEPEWLDGELCREGTVIFEGAQGILLDQFKGFMPYCTRSTISFANAGCLNAALGEVTRVGVVRSYSTRHGAGPFPTEDDSLREGRRELHNSSDDPWQQGFRLGHFDMVLLRYAVEALGGVDQIVLTHMDKRPAEQKICTSYDGLPRLVQPASLGQQFSLADFLMQAKPVYTGAADLVEAIERGVECPVTLLSYGTTALDKRLPEERFVAK